ncbi:MAG TPA: hypothetical protein VGJ97_00710 [Anaerolineaceae bacterium]|jgi:hypothetical protein
MSSLLGFDYPFICGAGLDGALVRWNGDDRSTPFVNREQLKAVIPGSDLAASIYQPLERSS